MLNTDLSNATETVGLPTHRHVAISLDGHRQIASARLSARAYRLLNHLLAYAGPWGVVRPDASDRGRLARLLCDEFRKPLHAAAVSRLLAELRKKGLIEIAGHRAGTPLFRITPSVASRQARAFRRFTINYVEMLKTLSRRDLSPLAAQLWHLLQFEIASRSRIVIDRASLSASLNNVHVNSVSRALNELRAADLIRIQPGRGRQPFASLNPLFAYNGSSADLARAIGMYRALEAPADTDAPLPRTARANAHKSARAGIANTARNNVLRRKVGRTEAKAEAAIQAALEATLIAESARAELDALQAKQAGVSAEDLIGDDLVAPAQTLRIVA